ncbi:hypothetical protein BDZ97DRAFT_1076253 [Flammula alnicola]|nr:hypothetical protein BDZ97DRAFT_1076253 [Flammula alnicola]
MRRAWDGRAAMGASKCLQHLLWVLLVQRQWGYCLTRVVEDWIANIFTQHLFLKYNPMIFYLVQHFIATKKLFLTSRTYYCTLLSQPFLRSTHSNSCTVHEPPQCRQIFM